MISKLFRDVPLPVAGTGIMGNGGFDNKKYFPGGGSTSIGYGGAGGYPADVFSMNCQSTGITVSNSNTGSGGAIENRPPYYALCYIMKT